jgi:hypothetical protein
VPERSLGEGEVDEEIAELAGDCARTIYTENCKTVKAIKPVIDRNSILYVVMGKSEISVPLMRRKVLQI